MGGLSIGTNPNPTNARNIKIGNLKTPPSNYSRWSNFEMLGFVIQWIAFRLPAKMLSGVSAALGPRFVGYSC